MPSITQDPYLLADYLGFAKDGSAYSGSRVTNLSSSQHQNTAVTIITAENDKVTLSADSEHRASYSTYSGIIRGGDATAQLQGKSYSIEVNQELSITIEGDLNEEELQDIQKSLKTIDKIMREALSGNPDQALSMIHDVSSMKSISGFSASLEIENTVSFEQQTIVESQTSVPEPTREVASGRNSLSRAGYSRTADKLVETLKDQGFRNKKLIRPLNKYFSQLFEAISGKYEGSEKSEKMGIAHRIRSEILKQLERQGLVEPTKNADLESERSIEESPETSAGEISVERNALGL